MIFQQKFKLTEADKLVAWWRTVSPSLPPSSKYENKYQRKQETPVISGLVCNVVWTRLAKKQDGEIFPSNVVISPLQC